MQNFLSAPSHSALLNFALTPLKLVGRRGDILPILKSERERESQNGKDGGGSQVGASAHLISQLVSANSTVHSAAPLAEFHQSITYPG